MSKGKALRGVVIGGRLASHLFATRPSAGNYPAISAASLILSEQGEGAWVTEAAEVPDQTQMMVRL